jgi:hypothetical protein
MNTGNNIDGATNDISDSINPANANANTNDETHLSTTLRNCPFTRSYYCDQIENFIQIYSEWVVKVV